VLFLCTGNSARSQIAEALLNWKGKGRFVAESAGSRPAPRVNPHAIATLERHGLAWGGHPPRGLDAVADRRWDIVITVCDNAKESCPLFPGQPALAHWGMPDPADVTGDPAAIERAFTDTFTVLSRRLDLLLALPLDKLERLMLEQRLRLIPAEAASAATAGPASA